MPQPLDSTKSQLNPTFAPTKTVSTPVEGATIGRSLIIIVAPMVLLVGVVTYVFFERDLDATTRRLARDVAGDVALLPGLGNGSFGPATLFGADALPFAIASVPLVQGKPKDLVVVSPETGLISVLRNTGK